MKKILNEWKNFIKEQVEEKTYLRFGDPSKVEKVSMIHDPEVEYDKEMRYFSQDPDGPRLQRYESGISAYPVLLSNEEKVVFTTPIGLRDFVGQVKGFLFERLLESDVYTFTAKQIFDKKGNPVFGTDDEPLLDKGTVGNIKRISNRELYVEENGEHNVFDMISPEDLKSHFIMGFPHIADTAEGIKEYFFNMKQKFSKPESVAILEEAEKLYLEDFDEEQ